MLLRRVVITGGAGFIGGHLAKRLVESGSQVTVLDNLSSWRRLELPDEVRFIKGDVRDRELLGFATGGASTIFHLASVVGVDRVAAQPEETRSVIIDGVAAVSEVARHHRIHVVFFSSSEVSDSSRSGPRAVYGLSKRKAEGYIRSFAHLFPVTIIRPFSVVGPGQLASYGMVLPTFVEAAAAGRALPIHGDGSQLRAFLHVDDLLDALLALLSQGGYESGAIFEIGSSQKISILDVAKLVSKMVKTSPAIRFGVEPGHREDRQRRLADLSALRDRVDFQPKRGIHSILRELIENHTAQAELSLSDGSQSQLSLARRTASIDYYSHT